MEKFSWPRWQTWFICWQSQINAIFGTAFSGDGHTFDYDQPKKMCATNFLSLSCECLSIASKETRRCTNAGLMLAQRRRRWANINIGYVCWVAAEVTKRDGLCTADKTCWLNVGSMCINVSHHCSNIPCFAPDRRPLVSPTSVYGYSCLSPYYSAV